ncbi:MAG: hypothetical protein M0Z37_06585 [Nitrospiraceae bacterium]|nr:hypothetical protein [Nitrospiraceae bacterium]
MSGLTALRGEISGRPYSFPAALRERLGSGSITSTVHKDLVQRKIRNQQEPPHCFLLPPASRTPCGLFGMNGIALP